jgi:hypothetical protein
MKKNPQPKSSNSLYLFFLAIAVATAIPTQSALANTYNVVFTEYSSTNLTATLNGTPVTVTPSPGIPDSWSVFFPAQLDGGPASWAEPENPGSDPNALQGWNSIAGGSFGGATTQITIKSDNIDVGAGIAESTNGGPITYSNTTYQFIDRSDVPDTGSTLALLSLALAGLFGASRIRSLQLA